jgi:hypothetical protein
VRSGESQPRTMLRRLNVILLLHASCDWPAQRAQKLTILAPIACAFRERGPCRRTSPARQDYPV